jgi:hypothetical protein
MKRILVASLTAVAMLGLALAPLAHAQQYKWIDKNGKTQYGDAPPAGVKAVPLKGPAQPPAPPPAAKDSAKKEDGKDGDAKSAAKKGPLTPAEQEAEFRKRRLEQEKSAEESAKKKEETAQKAANCEQSRGTLRSLESGERISRTNAAGERSFLDDAGRQAEIAKTQKSIAENCS